MRLLAGVATVALACGWSTRPVEAQSFQEALNAALANGCGADGGQGRLLSANQFATRTIDTENIGAARLEYQFTEFQDDTSPLAEPTNWGLLDEGTIFELFDSTTAPPDGPRFEHAREPADPEDPNGLSDPNGRFLYVDLSLEDDDSTPDIDERIVLRTTGGPQEGLVPVLGFVLQDQTGLTDLGAEFVPATGPTFYRQAFSVTITETQDVEITNERVPVGGLLGPNLSQLCSSQSVAPSEAVTTYSSDFTFNTDAGLHPGSSPGGFGTPGSGGPAIGAFSGQGMSATRAQETVMRRERGLDALIERLRRRLDRLRRARGQVASLADVAPGTDTEKTYTLVLDAAGGVVNAERQATNLEGGFSADTVVANLGAALARRDALVEDDTLMFGAGLGFGRTESTGFAGAPGGASDAVAETLSGSLFVGWTSAPFPADSADPAQFSLTASASYGTGAQDYNRTLPAARLDKVIYDESGDVVDEVFESISEQLAGSFDQNYTAVALQMTLSKSFGGLTIAPRAGVSIIQFETTSYSETITGAQNNGLALEYEDVSDEWVESRAGLALSYHAELGGDTSMDFGIAGDAVFIGDPETPLRLAYFAEDLRTGSDRYAINYAVDALDDQYYDYSASIGLGFQSGLYAYVNAFTRSGHSYLDSNGVILGVRLAL